MDMLLMVIEGLLMVFLSILLLVMLIVFWVKIFEVLFFFYFIDCMGV